MPVSGQANLQNLKILRKGLELRGKTIGIVDWVELVKKSKKSLSGLGMKVMASDLMIDKTSIKIRFPRTINISI